MTRNRFRPSLESLESRDTPSTMALDGSGNLSYQSAPGEASSLTISYADGAYTFADLGAIIDAPTDPGWFGAGTNAATVSLPVSAVSVNVTGFALLKSTAAPVAIANTGNVWVNGNKFATGDLSGIKADVTVTAAAELLISNYHSTAPTTPGEDSDVQVGQNSITGFGAEGVAFNFSGVNFLRLIGTNRPLDAESFTVASPAVAQFQIDGCAGPDSVTVASLAQGTSALINGGAGDDSVTVDGDNIAGVLRIDTGTGANTITVQAANPQDVTVDPAAGTITSPDWPGPIYFRSTGGTASVDVVQG